MARTRSEMRDVPLSISFSRVGDFDRSGDPDERGAGGFRLEHGEKRFERFRLDVPVRQIGGQLPQIVLPVASQQGVDLLLEIAHGQRIGRSVVALNEGRFQLLDFRFLRGSQLAPAQFVAGVANFLQHVAQLAGGAAGGGSGIVELMREPRGKLSERSQAVALLLACGSFRGFDRTSGRRGAASAPASSARARGNARPENAERAHR